MKFRSRAVPPGPGPVPGMAAILAVFLAALVYLTLCMDRSVNVYDEGLILFDATRVLAGDLPHRDFYVNYGPGQYYLLAILYKIFGASVLVERALDTIVRASIVALVLIVVGQAAPRRWAFLAAAGSLACLAYVGAYAYPVFPCLAASLLSLAILTPAVQNPRPGPGMFVAGVCAGVVMLFRYDVGIAVFGAECATVAFCPWFDGAPGPRVMTRMLVLFGAGFSVVVAPVAAIFALSGVVPDFVFQVVVFNATFYPKMRSLPFPRLWMLRHHPETFAVYLPVLVCAAAIPALIGLARRRPVDGGTTPLAASRFTLLGLVALTLVFFAKSWVHVSVIHMAMALVSSLALAAVLAQPFTGQGRAGRALERAALFVTLGFVLSWLYAGLSEASRNLVWAANPATWEVSDTGLPPEAGSCRVPAGFERMACFRIDPATAETIRYIQHRTAPDDRVFVGLSRHDKVFINDVLLYFATDRQAATKWYQFDPGLQTLAPMQEVMIRELERVKPKLIVIEDIWADWREPNDSALSSGITLLDDYLRRAFEPVATFGPNTILRPR